MRGSGVRRLLKVMVAGGSVSMGCVQAWGQQPERGPYLRVRLYNLAGVSARSVNRAVEEAHKILAAAGVETVWEQGDGNSPEANYADQRAGSIWRRSGDSRGYLALQIAGKAPNWLYPGALGFALPFGKNGIHVAIFSERVERFSQSTLATVSKMLGSAMAHEIGHVLLESCEHSSVGIMKARWGTADIQTVAAGSLEFTEDQAGLLRLNALRRGTIDQQATQTKAFPP